MATVVVRNGNIDGAIRTMKQKNAKDGFQTKIKKRLEGFEKPGVRKRKAREEAKKNMRKNAKKDSYYN